MRMIREDLRSAAASVSGAKAKYDFFKGPTADPEVRWCIIHNLSDHRRRFAQVGADISGYIDRNLSNGAYDGKMNDYGLVYAVQLLEKDAARADLLGKLLSLLSPEQTWDCIRQLDSFYRNGSNGTVSDAVGIEELKLGIEKGLNIREIAMLAGANRSDTHDNIMIFARYADYYRNRIEFGSMERIKEFINALRLGVSYNSGQMIYHARTTSDIEAKAPLIKAEKKVALQIVNEYFGANKAFYYQDGDLFICKHLLKGHEFATRDEGAAMSWVCKRNYDVAPRVRQIQLNR